MMTRKTFEDALELPAPTRSSNGASVARALGVALVALAAFVGVLRLAVSGTLPSGAAALLAPLTFLAMVASTFRVGVALGAVDETERPLLKRHGFWVIAIATVIALPALGTSGLIDPWETHYAEVAREMIERRDFVSPWWANEGWFMSKPVLTFWLEALSMLTFGVRTGADQILLHGETLAHPEWAVRFPGFALALVATYFLYDGVRRTCSPRAGFIGALALWTMPGFAILSHQAITDMPLVACTGASLGLLMRALVTTDAVLLTRYVVRLGAKREVTLHAGHLVASIIALVTISQLVMLFLQHVHVSGSVLDGSLGVHLRPDRLIAGSPHACSLPSQPPCAATPIAHPRLAPSLQATIWAPGAIWLVLRAASERRVARLLALMAWCFAALAAMAKGPAGLVVPAAAIVVFMIATRSLAPLFRLEVLAGLLLAVTMIGPWYLAVFARHGRGFIDELVMRHMLGRTLDHLHDTNEGEDVGIVYFVRQLGYATFPWSGLSLFAMVSAAARGEGRHGHSKRVVGRAILFGAGLVAFTLVSTMRTKFHHYVLVALPPIAMMTGIWIDELLAIFARTPRGPSRRAWSSLLVVGAALVTLLVVRDVAATPTRFILLMTYRYTRSWPSTAASFSSLGLPILGLASVAVMLAWLVAQSSRVPRRVAVLAQGVFALAAVLSACLLLDRYMPGCSEDGGQRAAIAAYYKDRARAPAAAQSPLIAYQLNWKGENFYTGNQLAIFISSGPAMKTYLDRLRAERPDRVAFYFVTERVRVKSLERELRGDGFPVSAFDDLTAAESSAEFALVRVTM